jgi:cytochrome P450 family 313
MAKGIPGPRGIPFFGEALSVIGDDHSKAFRSLTGLAKDYDTPARIWFGPYCAIILDNPKDLQIVLNSQKCIDKAEVYKFIELRKGLLVSGGDLWKSHRKLLDPSFNVTVLNSLLPAFNEKGKILIRELNKRVGGGDFDCYNQVSGCTLETLLLTMFRIERDVQSNAETNKYLQDMEIGTKLMNDKMFKVWYHFKPIFRLSDTYQKYKKFVLDGAFAIGGAILNEKSKEKLDVNSNVTSESVKLPNVSITHMKIHRKKTQKLH